MSFLAEGLFHGQHEYFDIDIYTVHAKSGRLLPPTFKCFQSVLLCNLLDLFVNYLALVSGSS